MELRNDAQWSLVVPTSMGVRITPENRAGVHSADRFFLQATSAETNVASVVSYLGEPAKVLTAFVEGSPIAALMSRCRAIEPARASSWVSCSAGGQRRASSHPSLPAPPPSHCGVVTSNDDGAGDGRRTARDAPSMSWRCAPSSSAAS